MENPVQDLRDLLRLAATLRRFAAEACHPDYARKLLRAAVELEMRAEFLAGHRPNQHMSDHEQERALHAPVDIRI